MLKQCGAAGTQGRPFWRALLAGWAIGLFGGTYLAWSDGLKPLHALTFGDTSIPAYVGLIAFAGNVVTAVIVNLVMTWLRGSARG